MVDSYIEEAALRRAEESRRKPHARRRKVAGAGKIRAKELPMFSRMLAAMLDSGIPLVQALSALEEQTQNKSFRPVIGGLRARIEAGSSFSDALREYPDVFDELYINMMKAGEAGGLLAEIAGRVARYLENANKLKSRVRSAMMYPTVVMVLALTIATAMIVWLVPIFADIYADFGSQLPGPTRFLLGTSNVLRRYFLLVGAAIFVFAFLFHKVKRSEKGRYFLDKVLLDTPLIGELAAKIAVSRFAGTFSQLIHSGVPILESMDIVAFATGNKVFGGIVLQAKTTVEGGDLLSTELERQKRFPRMLVRMLAAGEKTGKMDEMLERVADFYDDEVEQALNGLTSTIEPLLMVFLGIVVGGIMLGMFMPLFRMTEILGN